VKAAFIYGGRDPVLASQDNSTVLPFHHPRIALFYLKQQKNSIFLLKIVGAYLLDLLRDKGI
jgi:hypothetical protein